MKPRLIKALRVIQTLIVATFLTLVIAAFTIA